MFFRNLTLFRFPTTLDLSELDTRLAECQLKPVGPLELSSRGFVSPVRRATAKRSSHRIARRDLADRRRRGQAAARRGGQRPAGARSWPRSSRRKAASPAAARASASRKTWCTNCCRAPSCAQRAPMRCSTCEHGLVAVDTSIAQERRERGQRDPPRAGQLPGAAAECRSRAALGADRLGRRRTAARRPVAGRRMRAARTPIDSGAVVKCQRQELQGDEIAKHLESGKQVTRLALTLDDHVSLRARRGPGHAQVQAARRRGRPARKHRARGPARRTRCALRPDGAAK